MTKTAITQHLEYLVDKKNGLLIGDDYSQGYARCINEEITLLTKLLPTEREQITDAFEYGLDNKWNNTEHIQIYESEDLEKCGVSHSERYFNKNFQ